MWLSPRCTVICSPSQRRQFHFASFRKYWRGPYSERGRNPAWWRSLRLRRPYQPGKFQCIRVVASSAWL